MTTYSLRFGLQQVIQALHIPQQQSTKAIRTPTTITVASTINVIAHALKNKVKVKQEIVTLKGT